MRDNPYGYGPIKLGMYNYIIHGKEMDKELLKRALHPTCYICKRPSRLRDDGFDFTADICDDCKERTVKYGG